MDDDQLFSPLRRRMIEDMTARNFAPHTQSNYILWFATFAGFLKRSPDTASHDEVRRFSCI